MFEKKKILVAFGILLFAHFTSSTCAAQEGQGLTAEKVNKSIQRGVEYLKSRQHDDGSWDEFVPYPGGITALVTLSLLSCDVPADSPTCRRALEYLRKIPPQHTYVVGLQTMAFAAGTPNKDFALIRRNADWLMNARLGAGNWTYTMPAIMGAGGGDNSNTQYALLGLRAASESGVVIPNQFWKVCRQHWLGAQDPRSGAWGYTQRGSIGSMTVAGIASLIITGQQFETVMAGAFQGTPVRCNGSVEDRNIRMGLDWIGRNWEVGSNPGGAGDTWLYYYYYGLERAGRLAGRRFIGEHDWYRAIGRSVVAGQMDDGSWPNRGLAGQAALYNSAFALLFLSKGKIPIIVNKLEYGLGNNWNKAPNDVHNLVDFLSQKWKTKLNWQILDFRSASPTVEDLLQAPILQFSGHAAPILTPGQKKLLRNYVDQGGVLMVDANCGIKDFDRGFRNLCKEIFPEPELQLRKLDDGHGVWHSLFQLEPTWPLYGIDIGCRTAVFYSPEDLSCQWEHSVDPSSAFALRMGANIVAYVTGPENLEDKLDKRKVIAKGADDAIKRGFLQIAKLKHNGDWNPAPNAIRNLMSSLKDNVKVDVIRQQRDLEIVDQNLAFYPLCYMHGRNRFVMTKQEKDILAQYLKQGGVLFADACCGSERFDDAFRALMTELFPDKKLDPIPPTHELFTQEIGFDLSRVKYNKSLGMREGPPLLEGVQINGRYAVIYSKYDIGCALERQKSSECKGYDHESAVRIATNVVLYSLKQ